MRAVLTLLLLLLATGTGAVERKPSEGTKMENRPGADSALAEADAIFQDRNYTEALEKYQSALEIAQEDFNRPVETEALAQIARLHLMDGQKEEGRSWLEQAKDKASDSDPMGWSRYLGVRGRFEWKDDNLASARATFDEMYEYCNTNGLWARSVDAAHMIAIVAESPEEQIKWSQRGIEAAESGGIESWLGPLWNNLAITYYEEKQLDTALACFLKAREYHWRHSGEVAKLFADYHVGMTYRSLGKLDEAGQWLRPVLAWAERLDNKSAIGQACDDLGEVEIAKGNKAAGLELLKRARATFDEAGFDKSWPEVWEKINARIKELEN